MQLKQKIKFRADISYIPLLISACVTVLVVYIVYTQTQDLLKERLREQLVSIASTAVLQIDPKDIENINNEKDLNSPQLKRVVDIIRKVRDVNSQVRYIYIWRKSSEPDYLEFVADAEMIEPIDIDGNGKIEDVEIPPLPGEKYEINQVPQADELFIHAFAQNDFIIDKWGIFMSGFAPVLDNNGNPIAVLGIDVEVTDFYNLIRATFVPFFVLAALLLSLLTIQTILLLRIWKSRVKIVQELDRQKDELLSIVSHQLAAPVTAVKWYLELLQGGDLGTLQKEQQESIRSMQSIAVNLADLVSMILDVSRIQLGKMKVDKQELDFSEFCKEILDVIEPKTKEKKVKFIKKVPEKFPVVKLDKRLTRMTIENLLTNAVKYTPTGGEVKFHVEIKDNKIYYSISDTGCGIPKAEQSKVFGKLFRATNVRNKIDGNGFGLYVAKGAIEAQGGSIRFESAEGKGTTFYVELPIK